MIDPLTHGKWQMARRIRNKAIHGTVSPTLPEVTRLLEVLDLDAP
jgi:hypothetical protein